MDGERTDSEWQQYELAYPRTDRVNWWYVAEKAAGAVGVLFVMSMVSQTFIYPVVVDALAWKDVRGWDTARRFREFPWLLSDLIFPFMMEYLVSWRRTPLQPAPPSGLDLLTLRARWLE